MNTNQQAVPSSRRLARLFGAALFTATIAVNVSAETQSDKDLVPRKRTVPTREQVKKEIEESRFALGGLRILPIVSISNAGYTSNAFGSAAEPTPDFTATVGAGARWILPAGKKIFLRGQLLPEYIWYANLSERNTLGGQYDASVLGLFNRMSFEAKAGSTRQLSVVSSESELSAVHGVESIVANVEVDVLHRMSLFAGADTRTHRYDYRDDDASFEPANLDRRDAAARVGVRYHVTSYASVSLEAEQASSAFERPDFRNNQSRTYLAGLRYELPRSYLHVAAGQRVATPSGGSQFPGYSELVGSYVFSYSFARPIEFQIHGNRRPVFAASTTDPYYMETRNGTTLRFRVGHRGGDIWTFGELGENRYPSQLRVDKVVGYGGGVGIPLYRDISLNLGLTQTDVTSNTPGFDRKVMRVISTIGWKGTPK